MINNVIRRTELAQSDRALLKSTHSATTRFYRDLTMGTTPPATSELDDAVAAVYSILSVPRGGIIHWVGRYVMQRDLVVTGDHDQRSRFASALLRFANTASMNFATSAITHRKSEPSNQHARSYEFITSHTCISNKHQHRHNRIPSLFLFYPGGITNFFIVPPPFSLCALRFGFAFALAPQYLYWFFCIFAPTRDARTAVTPTREWDWG